MTTTTAFIHQNGSPSTRLVAGVATIDNGETATLAIPCAGRAVVRIGVPTITVGTLTFTVVPYKGATARTLKDSSGNTVTVASSTGGFVVQIPELSGAYSFTIVAAAQGAARTFDIQCTGEYPGPASSNEITVEGGTIALSAGSALIGKVGIDQTTPGTTDSVSLKTQAFGSIATTTRAANQTPYTANDVVGAAFDLGIMGPASSRVLIQSIILRPRITAVPAGMGNFRLALYNVTPPSALADNAAWTIPAGDQASFLAILDLGTPALPAAGSVDLYIARQNIGLEVLLPATAHLFAYLVTDTVFTPAANSEVYALDPKTVAL